MNNFVMQCHSSTTNNITACLLLIHGEVKLRTLCRMFNFPLSDMKIDFSDYKDSKGDKITKTFQKLLNAVDTVPVSTAACERGFSQMNDICTSLRSQLTVLHISSLMFINIVGPPVNVGPSSICKSMACKEQA